MFWLTAVVVTAFSTVAVRCSDGQDVDFDRLPDDTEPRSYTLRLTPDLDGDTATFAGQVDISIAVKTSTSAITLHSKDLVLYKINVTDEITDRDVRVHSWTYAQHREWVEILLDEHVLASRKYKIHIQFGGVLRDNGTGYFKSVYENASEGKRWISATQFQTTQARSAFPCYDVPYYRTPFNISIQVKNKEIALSNMPVLNTVYFNDYFPDRAIRYQRLKWVYFAQTPAMPTCSVAFFTGRFEQLDTTQSRVINVYSHLGNLYQIEYVTKAAPDLLRAMEEYTGLPYSMPKLDLLAMPMLGEGPVNSWGLTSYREKMFFVDWKTDTKTKVSAMNVVAHAMANQWFGNYVTPARWDFAWLSEGLATYLEYFATGLMEPEWRLEHFFVVDKQRPAMDYDQSDRRPLTTPVLTPAGDMGYYEAERMLYDKAASIMRMLNDWVGEEAFKKAINMYLSRNQYATVTPEHLWNAFDNALFDLTKSGLNSNSVGTVMKTWTEKAGYPVVNVKKKDKSLVLTQQRFSSGFIESNDTTKWFIRLSYTTNKDKNFDTKTAPTIWLDPSVNETVVPIDDDVEWYIFNIQSTGFYRVNYTEDNWLSLIKQLNDSSKDVHVLNRAQLIDDSFSLAKVGLLDYKIPLSFTEYLKNEDDIIPWFSAMNNLNCVLNRMRRFKYAYFDFKILVSDLAGIGFRMINELVAIQKSPQYPTNIGWNRLSAWACRLPNLFCLTKMYVYYNRWENGEEIPADIRDAAFCFGARRYYESGSLDKLLDRYNTTKTYSERRSVMNAIACVDTQSILKYLTLILEDKCPIEPRDYEDFFEALSSTANGITALNYFLHEHASDVIINVKNGRNLATKIFSILVSKASTESEIEKVSDMVSRSMFPDELRIQLVPLYRIEVENNEKWYNNGGPETIWRYINPSKKQYLMDPSEQYTTQSPLVYGSSASSISQDFVTILQILALSVSVKLLVNLI